MGQINRAFTGFGYNTPGGRRGYSWVAIGTGPTDQNPLILQHGNMDIDESVNVTPVETTAFNGYTDCYSGSSTITGKISGYVAASDGDHATDPVSIKTGTRAYIEISAGTLTLAGYCLIKGFSFKIDVNEFVSVEVEYQFKGVPNLRKMGFLAGVGCLRP